MEERAISRCFTLDGPLFPSPVYAYLEFADSRCEEAPRPLEALSVPLLPQFRKRKLVGVEVNSFRK